MKSVRVYLLCFSLAFLAAACSGSGNNDTAQAEKNTQMEGLINARAQAYNNSFALFNFQTPTTNTPQVVAEPAAPEEKKPDQQSLITGHVVKATGLNGSIVIEAHEAIECETGHCSKSDALPLATTVLNSPGFFSLVLPHQGQAVLLSAHSEDGQKALSYLGALNSRLNDIELILQP